MSTKLFSCSLLLLVFVSFVVAPPPPQIIVTAPHSPGPHHPNSPAPSQVDPFQWHDLLHSDYIDTNYWFRVIENPRSVGTLQWHLPKLGDVIRIDRGSLTYYKLERSESDRMKYDMPKDPSHPGEMMFENEPLNAGRTLKTVFLTGMWANIHITDLSREGVLKSPGQIIEIKYHDDSLHSHWDVKLLLPAEMKSVRFFAAPIYPGGPLPVPKRNNFDHLPRENTVKSSWEVHIHGEQPKGRPWET
ncbi:hypothetical protein F5887DRAFT_1011136 [Amanita rubescens]|nr:hypothetical protein F5887DRAFT_1011136 [Amanita rubescens]